MRKEINIKVNDGRIKGTIYDPARVNAQILAAFGTGEGGGSLVTVIDDELNIYGNFKIQFDRNEFYSYCWLNPDENGDPIISVDEDFNNVSGVTKTYLIAGNGSELIFLEGTGAMPFHLLSGEFDKSERSLNVVTMLYSDESGVWVTITNKVVGEDVTIKAPIPSDDSKVDKLEGYSLVADTEIAKIHSQNTDQYLDFGGANELYVEELWNTNQSRHDKNGDQYVDFGSDYQTSSAELRGVVDFANIATPPTAYQIPVVQDVAGVKSLKYSADFVFENGTLKVKGAGNTTGKTLSIFNLAGTENVTVLDSGNVGIGTDNPQQKLHVQKDQNAMTMLQIINKTSGNIARSVLRLESNGNNAFQLENLSAGYTSSGFRKSAGSIFTGAGAGGVSFAAAEGALRFYSGGEADANERIRILSTGNVGISTTTPAKSLEVSHATGDCFRLSYDKSTTYKADFTLNSAGKLTIAAAGGHEFTGDVNLTGVLKIDGVQVVKEQQAAISEILTDYDDFTTFAEATGAVNTIVVKVDEIIRMLRAHGLILTL